MPRGVAEQQPRGCAVAINRAGHTCSAPVLPSEWVGEWGEWPHGTAVPANRPLQLLMLLLCRTDVLNAAADSPVIVPALTGVSVTCTYCCAAVAPRLLLHWRSCHKQCMCAPSGLRHVMQPTADSLCKTPQSSTAKCLSPALARCGTSCSRCP